MNDFKLAVAGANKRGKLHIVSPLTITLGDEFHLSKGELGTIAATAFWGFPLAIIIGGMIVDVIGMKKLLVLAFIFLSFSKQLGRLLPPLIGALIAGAFAIFLSGSFDSAGLGTSRKPITAP